jgi:hypothetical protein
MSSEFASERPVAQFLWRLAHIAPIGYLVTAVMFIVIDLTLSRPFGLWVGGTIVALAIPMLLAHTRHENTLCGTCAAMTPPGRQRCRPKARYPTPSLSQGPTHRLHRSRAADSRRRGQLVFHARYHWTARL